MKRWLRRTIHGLMVFLLLIAFLLMVAWPVTSLYRTITVSGYVPGLGYGVNNQNGPHGYYFWVAANSSVLGLCWQDTFANESLQVRWNSAEAKEAIASELWHFESNWPSQFLIVVPLPVCILVFALFPAIWFTHAALRRRHVRLNRSNVCLHCNYDLRGTDSETCPECGKPRAAVTAGVD